MPSTDPTQPFGEPERIEFERRALQIALRGVHAGLAQLPDESRFAAPLQEFCGGLLCALGAGTTETPASGASATTVTVPITKIDEMRALIDELRALNQAFLDKFHDRAAAPSDGSGQDEDDEERIYNADGGIGWLAIDTATFGSLRRAGLLRIADVERADRECSLRAVRGIGPKRVTDIREAIAQYRAVSAHARRDVGRR